MTKKQQAERDAVWAHVMATTGAKVAERIRVLDDADSLQLFGTRFDGVRFVILEPRRRGLGFQAGVTISKYGCIDGPEDRSPIAAYNALCAAPFFATTVGVAFGLVPMVDA